MKVSDKSAKPVRLSGEDLIAGEVYKDEGGSIVMCTDENSVVCLKTGIVMDFMSGSTPTTQLTQSWYFHE